MRTHTLALPLIALAALAFPAAAQEAAPAKKAIVVDVKLEPGKVHEECIKLEKGKSRRFEWTSDKPVDFNVHYHKGPDAFYPFKANSRKSAKARFLADHTDDYCWMWTAQKETAHVKGRIAGS